MTILVIHVFDPLQSSPLYKMSLYSIGLMVVHFCKNGLIGFHIYFILMIEILKAATANHIAKIESLANEIWKEHYTPIIGIDQVVYMLQKYQSTDAIASQINTGYEYFIISHHKKAVGYLSVKDENDGIFLSKIYVLANQRGLGIGAEAIGFVEKHATKKGKPKIRLTVNKNNLKSKRTYEKLGFVECGSVVVDIGHGYVMDDFAMEKTIS